MRQIKTIFFLIISILAFVKLSSSQCTVNASADTNSFCLGDTVNLVATGSCADTILLADFNNSAIPSGWYSLNQLMFNNPCVPAVDGTPYCWLASGKNKELLTDTITIHSNNCKICFDMVFASSSGTYPCEWPDSITDGINFMATDNAALTFFQLEYYSPDDSLCPGTVGSDSCMTNWRRYCVDIPNYLVGTAYPIQFSWQGPNADTNTIAQFGLDNVFITCEPQINYVWSHNGTVFSYDSIPPGQIPSSPGQWVYNVTVSDSVNYATDSVIINVDICSGIKEKTGKSIKIYPIPANTKLIIQVKEEYKINLIDNEGRILQEKEISKGKNTLPTKSLRPGIYFLRFINSNNSFVKKLVIE